MKTWRAVTAVTVSVLLAGLTIGEGLARTALDHRLAKADGAAMHVEFAGTSALLSLVTRTVPLRVGIDVTALSDSFAEETGTTLDSVETADGLIGLGFEDGIGPLHRPTTAWVSLSVDDGQVIATVVSIAVGELQIQPGAVLGSDLTFTVPIPQGGCESAPPIDAVAVTDHSVDLSLTATASSLSCLDLKEIA